MPQAFYIVPIPEGGHPDQGLPGYPTFPSHPIWGAPIHPDQGLPSPPYYPSQGPVFPPIYPVDPSWGVPVGPRHPLLWLLPWLIKPAAAQLAVPQPPAVEKPDPDAVYVKVLVAVGPGIFKWAWLEQEPATAEPR